MTANDHAPTISRSLARWVIAFGVCLTAAGVLASFQLEWHNFVSTEDFQYRFLSDAFLPILMLGLLTTLIGSILWAWRATVRGLVLSGLVILSSLGLSPAPILINPDGWTGAFSFVYAAGVLIGCLLLVFAVVRTTIQYRAKSR